MVILQSAKMYSQTEKPGSYLPVETQAIIRDRYEQAARMVRAKKVLEVGGGAGFGIEYLARYASEMHCIEYSEENVALLKGRNSKDVEILQGDAHSVPYDANSFDVVIALAMIYYLNFDKFVSEMKRILRTDGTLFFCTSNKDVPGFVPAPYTTRYLSVPEIYSILTAAGFLVTIQGAFPSRTQNEKLLYTRSLIKDLIKGGISYLPGGKKLWDILRRQYIGEHEYLPESIDLMMKHSGDTQTLDPYSRNKSYRVIYVTAKKVI